MQSWNDLLAVDGAAVNFPGHYRDRASDRLEPIAVVYGQREIAVAAGTTPLEDSMADTKKTHAMFATPGLEELRSRRTEMARSPN